MQDLGGRKFIGFVLISVLLFVLVFVGKLPIDQFVGFITANFGFFVAGNAIEHFSTKK